MAIIYGPFRPHQRDDDLIEDVCDGSMCKSHPLFKEDPLAIQLIAYYDDVEVCNPLGSHRGINKLGKIIIIKVKKKIIIITIICSTFLLHSW